MPGMEMAVASTIDVVALLRAKNPTLVARLPPIALTLLRLVARERTVRKVLAAVGGCRGCDFVHAALRALDISVTVNGADHLPASPRVALCANHPTGGIDGLVLLSVLCRTYGSARVPANDVLMALAGLRDLLVPVDKHGSNRQRFSAYQAMYRSPHPLLVFPAGRTSRPRARVLREYPWTTSFVTQARLSGRPLVPVHLDGANSRRFYLLWRIRRALGITVNLEMFLLADELMRQRGTHRTVTIGTPVLPAPESGRAADQRLAGTLRREAMSQ